MTWCRRPDAPDECREESSKQLEDAGRPDPKRLKTVSKRSAQGALRGLLQGTLLAPSIHPSFTTYAGAARPPQAAQRRAEG